MGEVHLLLLLLLFVASPNKPEAVFADDSPSTDATLMRRPNLGDFGRLMVAPMVPTAPAAASYVVWRGTQLCRDANTMF